MAIPIAPNPDLLPLGKGKLLLNRYSSGALTQWRHVGNTEVFELTTEDDILEKFSSMEKAAPLYKKLTRRRNVVCKATLSEYDPENLAMVLMGETAEETQTATPVVDEAVSASVKLGAYYRLAKFGPYTAVTIEEAGGPTTLVEGTDFKWVDTFLGIFQLLEDATNIADGDALQASYTPTAYTTGSGVKTVRAGTKSIVEVSAIFISDPASGPRTHIEIWRASCTPDAALGLISEDWATIQLQMGVQADSTNHPNEPLYRMTLLPQS